eukprot:1159734-Pelagomonas_calceolata.AAC.3
MSIFCPDLPPGSVVVAKGESKAAGQLPKNPPSFMHSLEARSCQAQKDNCSNRFQAALAQRTPCNGQQCNAPPKGLQAAYCLFVGMHAFPSVCTAPLDHGNLARRQGCDESKLLLWFHVRAWKH